MNDRELTEIITLARGAAAQAECALEIRVTESTSQEDLDRRAAFVNEAWEMTNSLERFMADISRRAGEEAEYAWERAKHRADDERYAKVLTVEPQRYEGESDESWADAQRNYAASLSAVIPGVTPKVAEGSES